VTLVLLKEESSYGYELMERMEEEEEEFGFEQINPGSVYRALRQMEKEGLCSSVWDAHAKEGALHHARCTPPPMPGNVLEAWAEACEKYHRLMDQFARIYGRRTLHSAQ
jgi:PadR family transcriptional regulator, regulatory protein PadR